jgi:hypothetical protein
MANFANDPFVLGFWPSNHLPGVYLSATLPVIANLPTGVDAYTSDRGVMIWNGASWAASSVISSYTPPGTGAITTTVAAKLAQTVSVFDFMTAAQQADASLNIGSIDATASFQAAVNTGNVVSVPPGTYLIPGSAVTFSAPCILRGSGAATTLFTTNSATNTILYLNAPSCGIQGIGFQSSVTRTTGAYVKFEVTANFSHLRNFQMLGYSVGIILNGTVTTWISDGRMNNPAANAQGIYLTGGGQDTHINKITMSAGSLVLSATGIQMDNTSAVFITDCDIIRHGQNVFMNPGNGQQVTYIYMDNSFFDTALNGVTMTPSGTGLVQGIRLNGCWCSAGTGTGVLLNGNGTITGVELIGLQCFSNAANGVAVSNGSDISIIGGAYCGNTQSGISIAANINGFKIIGARIGNGYSKPGNANGIFIATGTSNQYTIIGNDLTGNTSAAISDGGSGTSKNIRGNIGLPVGLTTTIVPGASPYTYTAGPLPETIYINQGTVSLVQVNGVSVFQSSNVTVSVQPNQTVVVTYTVAPGMAKTINNN